MAIVKELKNLGKKMTGENISGNIISETLKAIEQGYSGGSADSYELVEEIEVGEMTYDDHDKMYYTAFSPSVEFNSEDYYLGDEKEKSTSSDSHGVLWNATEDLKRVDLNKPIVGVTPEGLCSDEDISGQVVEIYKKVEQGGDSQISEKVFDFTATVGENETLIVTPGEGVTWEAIKSALEETDNVFAHIGLPSDFMDASLHLRFSTIPHDGTGAGAAGLIQAASYVYAVGLNVIASGGETRCVGSLARLSTT